MLIREMKPGDEHELGGYKVRVIEIRAPKNPPKEGYRGPRVTLGFTGPDGRTVEVDLWDQPENEHEPIDSDSRSVAR